MFSSEAKRSANFTTQEVDYLLKLVDDKKCVVECKKTDRTSAADKARCWMEIQDDFNVQFENFRSHKTLKIKYENLKKNAKKSYAMDKQEYYKTGGGPKPPTNITQTDQDIIDMLETELVEGTPAIYDDDKIESYKVDLTDVDENESECFDKLAAESTPKEKWTKYTPRMLKDQKSSALSCLKRTITKDVWCDVAKMKIRKMEVEIKAIEEETKLKKEKLELEIEEIKQRIGKKSNNIGVYPKEF